MTETVRIVSPIDGTVYAERPVASGAEIDAAVTRAQRGAARLARGAGRGARRARRHGSSMRCSPMNDEIVPELAWQMGRPVRYGGEKRGVEERARHMIAIAEAALAPLTVHRQAGLHPLHRARAAGHRDGDRALELSRT